MNNECPSPQATLQTAIVQEGCKFRIQMLDPKDPGRESYCRKINQLNQDKSKD